MAATAVFLLLVLLIVHEASQPVPLTLVVPTQPPQPTQEFRAVLEMPSPTATSTPKPTSTPSPGPYAGIDLCASPEKGKLCVVPDGPPPTLTAYPDCATAIANPYNSGDLCVWH